MPNLSKRKVANKSNVECTAHVKQARVAAACCCCCSSRRRQCRRQCCRHRQCRFVRLRFRLRAQHMPHPRACVCMKHVHRAHSVCPASFLSSHRQADHASGGTVNFLFMVSSWYLHGCIVTTAVTTARALVCPCADALVCARTCVRRARVMCRARARVCCGVHVCVLCARACVCAVRARARMCRRRSQHGARAQVIKIISCVCTARTRMP